MDLLYPTEDRRWFPPWTAPLPNVRKLVVSDVPPAIFASLIRCCPQLEDVEYRWHNHL